MNVSNVLSPLSSTKISKDVRNAEMAMSTTLTRRSVRNVQKINLLKTTVNVKFVQRELIIVRKQVFVFNVVMVALTTIP